MKTKLKWHMEKGGKNRLSVKQALCGTDIPLVTRDPNRVTCWRCSQIMATQGKRDIRDQQP